MIRWRKIAARVIVFGFGAGVALMAVQIMLSRSKVPLGLFEGKLQPCPETPNCLCSETGTDAAHYFEPFLIRKDAENVLTKVAQVVSSQPRAVVITINETYLHAEFTSALFRFVDDVEFRYEADTGELHVRSASRVGKSDLGANKKRLKALREQFEQRRLLLR